ncbi:NUDIX hydrolase [Nocardia asteroides]|uniref:NUDIX hydrolase n=1 Tax=Nocardia asteroides TaxID=1824 RepID=UPI001E65020A|nr:NUDIX domain-containing protein [Nocardia asteroides]UGT61619.1 NUDIX domain-containing protein [Nocardia asteroides]
MTEAVAALISSIDPADDLERAHLHEAAAWVARTPDIYRRVKPATPPRHLVSYVVVTTPERDAVFLVDHRKAGMWLPPGGHVEPGEDPGITACREAEEELGLRPELGPGSVPLFLTITTTVNVDSGHEDVSLWYVTTVEPGTEFTLDDSEFRGGRWWTRAEIAATDPARLDPHLSRFLAKLAR